MPGCNPAFRPDKKLDVNKIRLLVFIITSIPVQGGTMENPRLLDQVRDAIRVRHYSLRTEATYLQWIKRFILFHKNRHPRDMGEQEITAFLALPWTRMSRPRPKIKHCRPFCFWRVVRTSALFTAPAHPCTRGIGTSMYGTGTAGPQRRQHHHDLHPCVAARRARGTQSVGPDGIKSPVRISHGALY